MLPSEAVPAWPRFCFVFEPLSCDSDDGAALAGRAVSVARCFGAMEVYLRSRRRQSAASRGKGELGMEGIQHHNPSGCG